MNSSRIFVRGLPPNLTHEDFHRHFSNFGPITDSKLLSRRRIGYIGYKTNEDAARAVKYFNKTFIRLSKIAVELARSIEDECSLKSRTKSESTTSVATIESHLVTPKLGKRKRGVTEQVNGSAKFEEYLHVMQPPSKSKIWSNEDLARQSDVADATLKSPRLNTVRDRDNENYENIPKKFKNALPSQQDGELLDYLEENPITATDALPQSDAIPEAPSLLDQDLPLTTDGDWLRSRTTDLVEMDCTDDAMPINAPAKTDVLAQESIIGHRASKSTVSDLSVQAEAATGSQISTPAITVEHATGRIFVRNLAYATTEEDLREYFTTQGLDLVPEVHLPRDHRSGQSKGYAYVQYGESEAAKKAVEDLDGKPFHGRLLHIMPANAKKHKFLDEIELSKLPLKKQQQIKRKAAASSVFNWNSLFMSVDAVISSISDRLGVPKSTVLDPTSSDAAIKQALAETHIIEETKAYFLANGVNLDAFTTKERSKTAILVKNFAYGTTTQELAALFNVYGNITRILMPPSGTISIIEFAQPEHAQSAFNNLAYRKFKDSILFLEKAPKTVFNIENFQTSAPGIREQILEGAKPPASEFLDDGNTQSTMVTSTLFVRNLNFSTTSDSLREVFQELDGFASARVKMKPDPKKPGQFLSMGFGFLEFRSTKQAQAALSSMDGYKLDGHELFIRASHKALDAAEERRREDQARKTVGTKIIIKNLPFETTKNDIRTLFGSYGKLRSVRVPKKFDSSTRGFAFADFVTAREAYNAMTALKDTHLLGRRLILDFAVEDTVDAEQEIEKMQEKVGKQANKIALQQLTSVGRRKFNIEDSVAELQHD